MSHCQTTTELVGARMLRLDRRARLLIQLSVSETATNVLVQRIDRTVDRQECLR